MKVLWLCNIMLPAIAKELGLPFSNREGWLSGVYERFVQEDGGQVELGICFPVSEEGGPWPSFHIGRVVCYRFRENVNAPEQYDLNLETQLKGILEDFQPDVVHIFGTEFPHAFALIRVWEKRSKILLGIQGLCYKIAEVYTQDLPERVTRRVTFRDWLKQDSLREQQEKFILRGRREKEVLNKVRHITGRTAFDREGVLEINPDVIYHPMNETMRNSFYTGRWERKACEPYSIFLSQGDYPVKGFHYMLRAMPVLLQKHPNTHLYVAGNSIVGNFSDQRKDSNIYHICEKIKDAIKISSYGKYLKSLIKEFHLEDKVTILGKLDEEAMKEQFLKSSVFVCPSIIENSPNALAEAMLLGVPVVAARTGGIPDMLTDGSEGLLYESGNITALAAAIEKAWDDETALSLSEGAAKRAAGTHDCNTNYERLMELYHEINLYL